MIDAGESAETARPPGSTLTTMALLAGGKRSFCQSRQRPRRWLLKMLRCRAPAVYAPRISRRPETLGTAALSASCTRDDSWISSPRSRPPKLCTTVDRQADDLWRSRSVSPVRRDAPEKPVLVVRSGRCRPSSLARARQLRSRLWRPRPTTARTQLALPFPPVVRSMGGASLRRSVGTSAAVQWLICVVADWLPAALASSAHLAYRWPLSGGAAVRHGFAVPVPWWSVPPRPTCSLPTHSQPKQTLSVCAPAFVPQQQSQQQPTGHLVMRGSRVVGLDPTESFSAQLQRLQDAGPSMPVGCSECSTEAGTGPGRHFSSLDDVCVCQCGAPAERPVWQKVRSRPKFTKPRCWHVDLVPKDPESSGLGELRPGRPPSSPGQVGLLGALVGRPMCA